MSFKFSCRFPRATTVTLLVGAVVTFADAVEAVTIIDPADDFISTFTGTKSGDIDVLSGDMTLSGPNFFFTATMNGTIGTLPTGAYVLGINRGAGNSNFANIGHGGVIFDSVVTFTNTGVVGGVNTVTNTELNLAAFPVTVTISGSVLSAIIPLGLLPSEGFTPEQYTWNLWPRDLSQVSLPNNVAISDFAPDNSNAPVDTTPLPAALPLFGAGLGVFGLIEWRRRRKSGGGAASA